MAFAGREASAKKIEKQPDANDAKGKVAPETSGANTAPSEKPKEQPVAKTPPVVKPTEVKPTPVLKPETAPKPAPVLKPETPKQVTVPSPPETASAKAATDIVNHMKKSASVADAPKEEKTPAKDDEKAVSSIAPTMVADSIPSPPKDASRKSNITPEEKKAALAAGGPVVDSPPPKNDTSSKKKEGGMASDPGIKVREVPNGKPAPPPSDAPKSEKTKEPATEEKDKKVAGWVGYLIIASGVVIGLLVMAVALKYGFKDTNGASVGAMGKGTAKATQTPSVTPTTPATAEPTVTPTPPTAEPVFTEEGLQMSPELMQRYFTSTDPTQFRYVGSEWKPHKLYLCNCLEVEDKVRGTYSEKTKKYHFPLSVDNAPGVSDVSGCRLCKLK